MSTFKDITNAELIRLINKTPTKLRATISGCEEFYNIEKSDFKASIQSRPDATEWSVLVDGAIYISRIPY